MRRALDVVRSHRILPLVLFAAVAQACGSTGGDAATDAPVSSVDDLSGTTKVCPTKTVEGIDVYDGDGAVDWNAARSAGIRFGFVKATQGTGNTQKRFATHWTDMKAAGVLRGAYHFFDPTQDGAVQAAHFLSVLGGDTGELPAVIDLECPNGQANCLGGAGSGKAPGSVITKRLHQWLSAVEAATGKKPILYTYPSYFTDAGVDKTGLEAYPLWIASLASCAATPKPWSAPTFWQYTFTGHVAGVTTDVDRDRFLGSIDDLINYSSGSSGCQSDADCNGGNAGSEQVCGASSHMCVKGCHAESDCPTGKTCDKSAAAWTCVDATNPPPPPPAPSGCAPVTFPSGITLNTVADAALTADYAALSVSACTVPKCFLDVTSLVSPDGTKHDVHVKVGAHFSLYELVHTDVDPNGTGDVDAAHAYSTKVLVSVDLVAHLDTLRDDYGGPVTLTSGFRSPAHQHAVCESLCGASQCTDSSGAVTCAKNSRHMWGAAADMDLAYESAANAAGFAFVFHENGGTGAHLHVDMQSCK